MADETGKAGKMGKREELIRANADWVSDDRSDYQYYLENAEVTVREHGIDLYGVEDDFELFVNDRLGQAMGHIEFEGFDARTTKALEKKVADVTGATMKQAVVVAFLENVDANGRDVREAVHSCTLDELTEELVWQNATKGFGASYEECTHLAKRLREIVRLPE